MAELECGSESSTVTIVLTPLIKEKEMVLGGKHGRRPVLMLSHPSRKESMVLGRNITTSISDLQVSRSLCAVEFTREPSVVPVLRVLKSSRDHFICLNGKKAKEGTVKLKTGDILSLFKTNYRYSVHCIGADADTSDDASDDVSAGADPGLQERWTDDKDTDAAEDSWTSKGGETKSSDEQQGRKRKHGDEDEDIGDGDMDTDEDGNRCAHAEAVSSSAKALMMDEITCSICMEILVSTHVAHPCGHVFCGPCTEGLQAKSQQNQMECPTCRANVETISRTRPYDNMIWNMILSGLLFSFHRNEDDLRQYFLRSGRNIHDLTAAERDSIFRAPLRQTHNANHHHNHHNCGSETTSLPRIEPLQTNSTPDHPRTQPSTTSTISILDTSPDAPFATPYHDQLFAPTHFTNNHRCPYKVQSNAPNVIVNLLDDTERVAYGGSTLEDAILLD